MLLFRPNYRTAPLLELGREMDQLINRCADGFDRGLFQRTRGFPAVNVWENDEGFCAEAEIPGVKMEDIEITVSGNEVTVKGHREPLGEEGLTYHRQERGFGEFARTIALPADVDTEKVSATLRDGVLTIIMPKAEAAKMRKIEVKGN